MRRVLLLAISLLVAVQLPTGAATPAKTSPKTSPKPAARPAVGSVLPSASAIPLLRQALAAVQEKRYPQAEQAFKQALKIMPPADPNMIVAVGGLTRLYYELDRYAEALPYAKMALPLASRRHGRNTAGEADAIYLLANIQHHLGDTVSAATGYRRSIAIYALPGNADKSPGTYSSALENLGSITAHANQWDEALVYYRKALSLRKTLPAENNGAIFENMGIIAENRSKQQEAAQAYEQALAEFRKNPAANQDAISRVSFRLGNLQGANVQTTGGTDGYNGQYYEAARKAYNVDHNYAEAARQFQLALDEVTRFRPGEQHFRMMMESYLGQSLFHADDIETALPHLKTAYAWHCANLKNDDTERLALALVLGHAYNGSGDYAQAQQYLAYVRANAPKDSPKYEGAVLTLADNLCHQGNFQEGKALYDEALALFSAKGPEGAQQVKHIQHQLGLLDKMFQSRQGIAELIGYSRDGLRRWSMEKAPVTIFLNTGASLPQWNDRDTGLVLKAFQAWQDALPDRLRFEFTNNPDQADVVVNWTDRPIDQTDVEAKVGLYRLSSTRSFFLNAEITLALANQGKSRTDGELYATALHEIGHMLGLQHSSLLSDVMCAVDNYAVPGQGWARLSEHDIQAARVLYQQPAAVTNPPGISLAAYRKFDAIAKPGVDAMRAGNYHEANRILEQARALYNQDPYINYFSGLSAYNAGDYKSAREIFEALPMPQSTNGFSVDSQLGLIYVELGHKYNKWGRKNRITSNEFYDKGVACLQKALQDPAISVNQKAYLYEKLREGQNRSRPMPVYSWGFAGMP